MESLLLDWQFAPILLGLQMFENILAFVKANEVPVQKKTADQVTEESYHT